MFIIVEIIMPMTAASDQQAPWKPDDSVKPTETLAWFHRNLTWSNHVKFLRFQPNKNVHFAELSRQSEALWEASRIWFVKAWGCRSDPYE